MTTVSQHAEAGEHSSIFQAGGDIVQNIGNLLSEQDLREELALVEGCYAASRPDEWERLGQVARSSPLVVITGDLHCGKRTVAVKLLSTLPGARTREMLKDWDRPSARMLPARPGTRYLLDLGDVAPDDPHADFGQALRAYAQEHGDSGIRLVVTMTRSTWERCAQTLSFETVHVTAPSARDVVIAHLTHLGQGERSAWLGIPPLAPLITEKTHPGDAVRLAWAIAYAPGSDEDAQNQAADEFQSWHGRLTAFFSNEKMTVEDRALFIAAAVLDGAPPLDVWKAAMLLLGEESDRTVKELLLGMDLDSRFTNQIEASVSDDKVSLDVKRHGISDAVLPHLWRQRPPLREMVLEWIRLLTIDGGIGEPYRHGIGRRLTKIAAKYPDFDFVALVTKWVDSTTANRTLVAQLLTDLVSDPSTGAVVRGKLWEWARSYGTQGGSRNRAEVVAEVCAGPFAEVYPNQTLVRLKWLLNVPLNPTIRQFASTCLVRLSVDPDQVSALLTAVVAWQKDAPQAAARGFLLLVDISEDSRTAVRLLEIAGEDPLVLGLLREGWRLVAAHSPQDEAGAIITSWLAGPPSGVLPVEPTATLLAEMLRVSLRDSRLAAPFLTSHEQPGNAAFAAEVLALAVKPVAEDTANL